MVWGSATVIGASADSAAWEESLSALADELWFWAVVREGLAAQGIPICRRKIARARLLARDVQIVAGLFGAVDNDRATSLLEAAHQLLVEEAWVDLEEEVTIPNRPHPIRLSSLSDDFETTEATMPGVPIEVFRKYLASVRH